MTQKVRVNFIDGLVSHTLEHQGYYSLTPFLGPPQDIEYVVPPHKEWPGITVFTDLHVGNPYPRLIKSKYKIALIHECRSIHPYAYRSIVQTEDEFDFILTHDPELLSRGEKYIFFGAGSSLVLDEDAGIHEKSKMCSLIASKKTYAPGHALRHEIASEIQRGIELSYDIDLWGEAFRQFDPEFKPSKSEPLQDYMFSITVMNGKHDNYFTETLIDTFRLGTVPIFWGCSNVGDFFNTEGIICFDTVPELFEILRNLTPDDYYRRMSAIEENFELAKPWLSVDARLPQKLLELCGDAIHVA